LWQGLAEIENFDGPLRVQLDDPHATPAEAALLVIIRPISARLIVMFWLGSGGSPMTVYRTTSLRIQGQRQVTAGVTRQPARKTEVRTVSNEKRMISALVCSVVISLDYWPVY
jgi:hypothetical protein